METKQAKVTLFTYTKNPLHAITLGIEVWHNPIPSEIEDLQLLSDWSEKYMADKIRWLFKQPHTTPLEYFNMVWVIKNASRAFQQQLTRYRMGIGYSIQSLRVVDVGTFAESGEFTMSNTVKNQELYKEKMLMIQSAYNELIDKGESVEDARGILPLNVHSPITLSCNYRALLHIIGQRMCHCVQDEWRSVVKQIRQELIDKVHPVFAEPFDCQCKRYSKGNSICKTDGKLVTNKD